MIEATTTVRLTGSIFDGSADQILHQGIIDARDAVIEEALNEVQGETSVFKHPTGRYRGGLHITTSASSAKVEPGRLPYVAWLEGTGKRNQTTRFKGYKVFERAFLRFQSYATDLFWQHLKPVVERLR